MLSLVIQAGGESSRMGQDKGLVPFLGITLIEFVVQRLKPVAAEVLVTTNHVEAYAFLDLPLYPDLLPGKGALGGLYTALSAANQPLVAVVACDMPFANAQLLSAECDILLSGPYDVVLPASPTGREPFHAVYRRESCLGPIRKALESSKRRVDSWFHEVHLFEMSWESVLAHDPTGKVFFNVNTPGELKEAESAAKK